MVTGNGESDLRNKVENALDYTFQRSKWVSELRDSHHSRALVSISGIIIERVLEILRKQRKCVRMHRNAFGRGRGTFLFFFGPGCDISECGGGMVYEWPRKTQCPEPGYGRSAQTLRERRRRSEEWKEEGSPTTLPIYIHPNVLSKGGGASSTSLGAQSVTALHELSTEEL